MAFWAYVLFGAGFFLGFLVIVAGRLMERIENTRILRGGKPTRAEAATAILSE